MANFYLTEISPLQFNDRKQQTGTAATFHKSKERELRFCFDDKYVGSVGGKKRDLADLLQILKY